MVLAAAFRATNRALKKIGDFISTVILAVFYFSIFGLFALPARFAADFLKKNAAGSTFSPRNKQYDSLDDFRNEG
jgi:hypothetical protein